MVEKGKELEKPEHKGGALAPAGQAVRGGLANESIGDLDLPRAILLQPTSPQVAQENSTFRPGQVIDSYFSKVLPDSFVPVFVSKRWVKYRDKAEGGGVEWQTRDPFDKRVQEEGQWKDGKPPAATEIWDYFVLFAGKLDLPIIISFSKTSFGAGRRLYSLFKFSNEDMWNRKYKWTAKMNQRKEQGKTLTYYSFTIDPIGESLPEERAEALRWYGILNANKDSVEIPHEEEPGAVPAGDDTPDWAK